MLNKSKENNMNISENLNNAGISSNSINAKYINSFVDKMVNKHKTTNIWQDYVSSNIDAIVLDFVKVIKEADKIPFKYSNYFSQHKKVRNNGAEEVIKKYSNEFRLENSNAAILKDVYV